MAWFRQWCYGDAAPMREGNMVVSTAKELQCTATSQVNNAFWDEATLSSHHLAESQRLVARRPATAAEIVTIWLADGSKSAGLDSSAAQVQAYLQQGTAVVLADLCGLGETADPAAAIHPKYYNREYRNALLALHEGRPPSA